MYEFPWAPRIKPSPPVAVTRSVLLFPDIRSPHEAPSNAGHRQAAVFLIFQIPHTAGAVQTAWSLCFSELERLGYPLDKSRPVVERYKKRMVDAIAVSCACQSNPLRGTGRAEFKRERPSRSRFPLR